MARGKLTVVSSPAKTESLSVLLQTGPRHQARGPLARAPRTSRQMTALLHAPCSSIRAPVLLLQQAAGGLAPGGRRRRQGASPIQSQRICLMLPKHMTALRQGVVPRAPEVMLDDAVQAHPMRLHLRRLQRIQGWQCDFQPEKDVLYRRQQ